MQQHDFTFESENLAREFIGRCMQEHPQDVAFFRQGPRVRVFNRSTRSIEESVEKIYATMALPTDTNPRRTRRISSTGIHAVKDLKLDGKP